MNLEDLTLKEIMALAEESLAKQSLLNSGVGIDYNKFCDRIEDAVLKATFNLESNKPQYSECGEDLLTNFVAFGLKMLGFDADHDTYRNGHCDLVVKEGMYEWYGEAKLDDGPAYILEGFRQLSDRYTPGGPTSNRGGLIIYTNKENKVSRLETWIKKIVESYERVIKHQAICLNTVTGRTIHSHAATGLDFTVRHFPISLYHNPTDKSAKNRKKIKT